MYHDIVNLYGWAVTQNLPLRDFQYDEKNSSQNESVIFSDAQETSLRQFWLNEMLVSSNYDHTYGPKYVDNVLKLGNRNFDISEKNAEMVIGK